SAGDIGSKTIFFPLCMRVYLLVRPWEFDTDALHHGRTNKYTLMHKGTKIVLLPMSPAEIVKYEQDRMRIPKDKSKVEPEKQQGIKLKSPVLLATKTDLAELELSNETCYALVCKHALFSIDDASI